MESKQNGIRSVTCFAAAILLIAHGPASASPDNEADSFFEASVKPILESRCLKCHGRGAYKGGFSIETRESLLEGGEGGPGAVPGSIDESELIYRIESEDEIDRMPADGERLSDSEIATLKRWIEDGIPWPDGFDFGFRRAPITPRSPGVPTTDLDSENPIDQFIAQELAEEGVELDWEPVSDRIFARRVTMDLVGLLPEPARIQRLEQNTDSNKRSALIDELLGNRRGYADHWLTFWNDLLRNSYRGTGFIDNGRATITAWLYQSLYENKPYDQFVHELIRPVPGSEGFIKGIVWRGVVNASQQPAVQAAQNVSQVFLGTNLKCASCHDSFVNYWKLEDAYGLAAVFSEGPLEIHRCDRPEGRFADARFIFPELGTIDPKVSREERLDQLADLLIDPSNGRFARTIVNRLWARLFGRGLVEPIDDLDQSPWSQDLLDWLASDLVAHDYDLKRTLRLMTTSRAYQLPSVGAEAPSEEEPYQFQGPLIKRMTAEQFVDALSIVTQQWPEPTESMLKVDGRGQGGQLKMVRAAIAASESFEWDPRARQQLLMRIAADWIWSHRDAQRDPGGRILVRKEFGIDQVPDRVIAAASADNELVLYINGERVASSVDWTNPVVLDVTKYLRDGDNVIAAEVTNWPDRVHQRGLDKANGPNPAGFIAWIGGLEDDRPLWGIGSDESWLWATATDGSWTESSFEPIGWKHAVVLPEARRLYQRVDLGAAIAAGIPEQNNATIRASIGFTDPLLTALGRPNREQVSTRRDPFASTLQAMELTNGSTLTQKISEGALQRFNDAKGDAETIVEDLFGVALNRVPTVEERRIAIGLVGERPTLEGVEDLLWTIIMLPEFQLIY